MTQKLSDKATLRHLIGYIGEHLAEDYLCELGFNAYPIGSSGIGSRVGDLLVQRTWFHVNGYCEGHTDTFGVEVKTTLSDKFYLYLTPRQKKRHNRNKRSLPLLLVRIINISTHGIAYEIKEVPEAWTSSVYFLDWKKNTQYFDCNAPRKCHQRHTMPVGSMEEREHIMEWRRKKTIKHIRSSLQTMNYFNVYPFLDAHQTSLKSYAETGIIKKTELRFKKEAE